MFRHDRAVVSGISTVLLQLLQVQCIVAFKASVKIEGDY